MASLTKLCQAHYVAKLAMEFSSGTPIIFCGDLNSQPGSHVHRYLVNGYVNGKVAAPWYSVSEEEEHQGYAMGSELELEEERLSDGFGQLSLEEKTTQVHHTPAVRYLLDFTLNRFTRWLRILGIDAALETEDEEKRRTRDGDLYVIDRVHVRVRVRFRVILQRGTTPNCSGMVFDHLVS